MTVSVNLQTTIFLMSVALGAVIGFWYDIFRVMRRTVTGSFAVALIEDILFWTVSAAMFLSFFYITNQGEIRLYVFLGAIIGAALYFFTISSFFVKGAVLVLSFTGGLIVKVMKVILFPFAFCSRIFKKAALWAGRQGRKGAVKSLGFLKRKASSGKKVIKTGIKAIFPLAKRQK